MNSHPVIVLLMLLGSMLMAMRIDSASQRLLSCPSSCGDIVVPFPFGTTHGLDESKACQGTCKNLQGSYLCFCRERFGGYGKKDGTGCHPKRRAKASIFLLIASGLFFPAVGSSWIFWRSKKKRVVKLRRGLYIQNGGLILENMLWRMQKPKVFTAEDLRNATDNYDESRVLYIDKHNEPVYRGSLCDEVNVLVTIKRCVTIESLQIQEFINKLVILFGIQHTNFVNLIGCCLETRYPLLVYEFFTDKTLYDFIHNNASFLSWEIRLKIAEKTARAIVYLHDEMSTPIVHGNIKSSNILLDSDYTVKVALPALDGYLDTFGYLNREWDTFGYLNQELDTFDHLNPEACLLGKLTNKSDVYSFGIVLAELLTGEQLLNLDRPKEGEIFLDKYFVSAIKEDRMREILVQRLVEMVDIEQLKKVAMLTERCLRNQPEERPTMFEVATELQNVILELDNDPRS
ncbi:Wall-associated receptor kinase 3 [Forsythia ovata]|uniref:Wall-associated receptor kinase 3 n=1 Tax=Forsythia ovata TaxID=205694 RepID=A0ABD1VMA2_9LAMI